MRIIIMIYNNDEINNHDENNSEEMHNHENYNHDENNKNDETDAFNCAKQLIAILIMLLTVTPIKQQ